MSINKRRYFEEAFQTALGKAGFTPQETNVIVTNAVRSLHQIEGPLPQKIFNIRGTIEEIAREQKIPYEKAKTLVIFDQEPLLVKTGLKSPKVQEKDSDQSQAEDNVPRMPADIVIARAAQIIKLKTGRLPNRENGKEELPEGSYAWNTIMNKLTLRGTTLRNLIIEHKDQLPKRKVITLDMIDRSARKTLEATGHRPTAADGIIEYGPLKQKYSWASVHSALSRGTHGLHQAPYKSLAECLDALGVPKTYEPANKKNIGHDYIIASALEMLKDPLYLRRPNAADGDIIHGPLAGTGTWSSVHQILVRAAKSNPDAPASLSALLNDANLPKKTTLSVQDVFLECAEYAKERPQEIVSGIGPYEKPLAVMDKVLREKRVEGIDDIATEPVTGVIDFMLATGLLEKNDKGYFAAPLPHIDYLAKVYA